MPEIHWSPAAVAACAPLAVVLLTMLWIFARWVWYRTPVGRVIRDEWFAFTAIGVAVAVMIVFETLT